MNFFVKTIVLSALLYATRGNGANLKRSNASWEKGYDYVSDSTTNSAGDAPKVIGFTIATSTYISFDTDYCWGRYSRRSIINSIESRTSALKDTPHRGRTSCVR